MYDSSFMGSMNSTINTHVFIAVPLVFTLQMLFEMNAVGVVGT